MNRFTGKTVLVTGAGSGLGRAIALAFAAEGASVVAAGRTAASLEETVGLIEAAHGTAAAVTADVTDSGQLQNLVRESVTRFGGLDIAVNNAGILRGTVPVGEVSEEDWEAVLRTNVTGVWLAMKHEIAHMKENGGGAIVNISSILGAHLRIPNGAAYITSKAAVSALTRAAALDHIHQGIRINAVSPGASAAPMSLLPGETEADRAERVKKGNPLGRVAEAEEVAAAVLYLASPVGRRGSRRRPGHRQRILGLTTRRCLRPPALAKLRHDRLNASRIPTRAAAPRCRRRQQRPLVLIDVDEPGLADTTTRPSDTGAEATVFRADLRNARSLGDVARQIALAVGLPAVLANVAGIGLAADVLATSDETGDRIIGVNQRTIHGGR